MIEDNIAPEPSEEVLKMIRQIISRSCHNALGYLIPATSPKNPPNELIERGHFIIPIWGPGNIMANSFCEVIIEETTKENNVVKIELIGEGDKVCLNLEPEFAVKIAAAILQSIARVSKDSAQMGQ